MNSSSSDETRRSSPLSWLWPVSKWGLCLLVVIFVARRAWNLWQQSDVQELHFHWGWLLLSALAYGIAWIPSIWIWQQAQRILGSEIPFPQAARAYFCGHLGKYIPGKATVLVIRAGMVKPITGRPGLAAVTAAYETLYFMGVGVAVAVAWSPLLISPELLHSWPNWLQTLVSHPWLPLLMVTGLCLLVLPILSFLMTRISRKMVPRSPEDTTPEIRIPLKALGIGFLVCLVGWMIHGICLLLVLRSVTPNLAMDFQLWAICTGSVSLATSVGFLAIFAPGGVGVREGLLMETLGRQPMIAPASAMMAAVLLRLISFGCELLMAGLLYYGVKSVPAGARGNLSRPDGTPRQV